MDDDTEIFINEVFIGPGEEVLYSAEGHPVRLVSALNERGKLIAVCVLQGNELTLTGGPDDPVQLGEARTIHLVIADPAALANVAHDALNMCFCRPLVDELISVIDQHECQDGHHGR